MVSSTYAWFTLSTAPEVTGITTQVGANGNLEIALLTTATYSDTSLISSAVGDSSYAASSTVAKANITWGNLVDLSDDSYGLTTISLQPASLGMNGDKVNVNSPLNTPVYGADGRVDNTNGSTVSAVSDENGNFTVTDGSQTYGVRAVGSNAEMTAQQLGLRSAQALFNSNMNLAKTTAQNSLNENAVKLAAVQSMSNSDAIVDADTATAAYNLAVAMQKSLSYIEAAYRQAILASLADSLSDEAAYTAAVSAVSGKTLTDLATYSNTPEAVKTELSNLAKAQSQAASAVSAFAQYTGGTGTVSQLKEAAKYLMSSAATQQDGLTITVKNTVTTGADTSCVFGDVADYIGGFSYTVSSLGGLIVQPNGTAKLTTLSSAVSGYTAASGSSTSSTKITDAYGYILDFAVRTNAASSNLLLQTAGTQRVYSDSTSTATMGGGSTLKLSYSSGLTATQATKLLSAINVVFMNPEDGTIYGTAVAGDIAAGDSEATANLYLESSATKTTYTLGKDAYTKADSGVYKLDTAKYGAATDGVEYTKYETTISSNDYSKLAATTTSVVTYQDQSVITALEQNTVKKVSALVYMDGSKIDNSSVINAASSGALTMNLQFSSSADLVPMSNTSLKQIADKATGASGAKITGEASMNLSDGAVTLTAALTDPPEGETISSVVWSSSDTTVATVTGSSTTASVTAKGVGATKITALVVSNKGNVYTATQSFNVLNPAASYNITLDGQTVSALNLEKGETATVGYKLAPTGTTTTIYGQKWGVSTGTSATVPANSTGETVTITASGSETGSTTVKLTLATQQKTGTDGLEPDFDNNTKTVELTVNVGTKATDATLSTTSVTFVKNGSDSTEVTVSISGSDDSIANVSAVSSDTSVATVSVSGTTLTVKPADGISADGEANIVVVVTTANGATIEKTIAVTYSNTPAAETTTSNVNPGG
jgi:hypothetical protein